MSSKFTSEGNCCLEPLHSGEGEGRSSSEDVSLLQDPWPSPTPYSLPGLLPTLAAVCRNVLNGNERADLRRILLKMLGLGPGLTFWDTGSPDCGVGSVTTDWGVVEGLSVPCVEKNEDGQELRQMTG